MLFIRAFTLLGLISITLFGAETLYSWGYGDILGETLRAIKFVFASGVFLDSWKFVLALSLISVALYASFTKNDAYLKLPILFFFSMGVWTLFSVAKIDIYIDDRSNPNNNSLIPAVPWAVGYPIAKFSQLENEFGLTLEYIFSIPETIGYSQSGFLTPLNVLNSANNHKIIDPNLYLNVHNYILECVMPDIESGYKNYRDLVESDSLWSYLGGTNPAFFAMYRNLDGSQELKSCTQFYNDLSAYLNTYITTSGINSLANNLGIVGATEVSNILGVSSQWITGTTQSATATLLQTISMNTFSDSFSQYSSLNGMSSDASAYYLAKAETMASSGMIASGWLAGKYLPALKGILISIVVALTPFLPLILVTPIGFKALVGYFLMLSWLALWHIGEVVLNFIISIKAQGYLSEITGGVYNFQIKGVVDSSIVDYINMASSMYWIVPTIATLLVSGFSWLTLAGIASSASREAHQGASIASREMGAGSLSFGTASYNSMNANSMSYANSVGLGRGQKIIDSFNAEFGTSYNAQDISRTSNGMRVGESLIGNFGENIGRFSGIQTNMFTQPSLKNYNSGSADIINEGGGFSRVASNAHIRDESGNTFTAFQNTQFKDSKIWEGRAEGSEQLKDGRVLRWEGEWSGGVLQNYSIKDPYEAGAKMEVIKRGGGSELRSYSIGSDDAKLVIQTDESNRLLNIQGYDRHGANEQITQSFKEQLIKQTSSGFSNNDEETHSSKEIKQKAYQAIGQKVFEDATTSGESEKGTRSYEQQLLESTIQDLTKSGKISVGKTDTSTFNVSGGINLKNSVIGKISGVSVGGEFQYSNKDSTNYELGLSASDRKIVQEALGEKIAKGYESINQKSQSEKESLSEQDSYINSLVNDISKTNKDVATYSKTLSKISDSSTTEQKSISDNKMYQIAQEYIDKKLDEGVHFSKIMSDIYLGDLKPNSDDIDKTTQDIKSAEVPKNQNFKIENSPILNEIEKPKQVDKKEIDSPIDERLEEMQSKVSNIRGENKKVFDAVKKEADGLDIMFYDKDEGKFGGDVRPKIIKDNFPDDKPKDDLPKILSPSSTQIVLAKNDDVSKVLNNDATTTQGVSEIFDKKIGDSKHPAVNKKESEQKDSSQENKSNKIVVPQK